MKRLASFVVALSLLGARATDAQDAARTLDVVAGDSTRLRATYYSPGTPGPAMLLLHQCNMDRRAWAGLGAALARRGIHALAFDYRGFGESPRPRTGNERASDIDAAWALLKAQSGVDPNRLGVAGASCGVENANVLARGGAEVKAMVLLSGPTSPDGLAFLRAHPDLAIFAAASSSEPFAVNSLREVTATSTHPRTTLRVVEKVGHGTPLFDAEPALLEAVVSWLSSVLR